MERDFNLIRQILLKLEEKSPGEVVNHFEFEDISQETIAEHIHLMIQANLIEGKIPGNQASVIRSYIIFRITWDGHDFLANIKNDTIWKKVTSDARDRGISMPMVVLNGVLTKAVEKFAGLE